MIASPISSPVIKGKRKFAQKNNETSSSMTTTNSSVTSASFAASIPTTVCDNMKLKNDFIAKLLKIKNESLNNPLFTLERYSQTIELINNAKVKNNAKRNDREISLLKTYDVINLDNQDKLVKKLNASEDNSVKYYVPINELFDVITIAHSNIGHRGIKYTLKEIKKKCANVTEKQVKLFISECYECKMKHAKPKNSSKLVIQPIISNDFNSLGQVDIIDMQSCPDGQFIFILNYQDHFTKFCILRPMTTKTAAEVAYHLIDIFTTFGAPAILQSDNGREFVAKIIEELALISNDLKIVHGKARHPQSQGSVERSSQDTKQLLGTWIRENHCTKWSEGLRFIQFQKNSCFHRVLKHSPYSVLFGNEPKLGLSSTSLHPSIFNNIRTEEELAEKLNIATADPQNINQCASDHETEDELDVIDELLNEKLNVDNILTDDDELNIIIQNEQNAASLAYRIKKTNDIRETAREGHKRQANEFLQNTAKKQKLANLIVGDNGLVPVPDVDRGPCDSRNVLAVSMDIKHEKFKLGTEQGVLSGYYSFHQITKASGTPALLTEHIDQGVQKSLREIVKMQSITGGQGLLKCSCKGGCTSSRCKCKQAKILCNSRCHNSSTCCNK